MKTAGIITYWDTVNNYGSILQNYALQQFLIKRGIKPFLIRTRFYISKSKLEIYNDELKRTGIFDGMRNLPGRVFRKLYRILARSDKKDSRRDFSSFIAENLSPTDIFTSLPELQKKCPEADFYIAGSDQIWNTYGKLRAEIGDEVQSFLLDFAPSASKKIACAASFGTDILDEKCNPLFRKALLQFDFISVREKSGVDICGKLGFTNVFLQPDPTMLLSADDYRAIESDRLVPHGAYILLYLLGNTTDFSIGRLKAFARKNGLEVVYVYANDLQRINFYKKTYSTINEWLGLFDRAEYVVTNSFHGTVFSLIFNKRFIAVPQSRNFSKQNVRIRSLLEIFGLSARIAADNCKWNANSFSQLFESVDWEKINSKLEKIRKTAPFVKYMEERNYDS
ncbi:polysaccharide pyruvyl transferase family protein [Treponema brennaborense]|uniref:Polysaccharide pyruvyl transferase domain-containing protein n=1 Tax=Treponema brennaborense (strain DSM 12168 / CIP 105900 / DD5/3) TaxID=906968 RepID=F4LK07_TREBD|nr:polysaccharide pyruvyl transferase family protein [Treponema brennaborense]AEE17469.1 hypothetical protein Trebr_2054 [Treponema brennaborense DSM 12168]